MVTIVDVDESGLHFCFPLCGHSYHLTCGVQLPASIRLNPRVLHYSLALIMKKCGRTPCAMIQGELALHVGVQELLS